MTSLEIATFFVDELCRRGQSVTSTCQEWALRAYELRELGTEGSQLYHRLSQIDHNYDSRGTTANFHSACRNPHGWRGTHRTLRSFFRLCRDLLLPLPPGYSTWQQLLGELYAGEEQSGEHAAPVTFSDITVSYIPDIYLLRSISTRSTFCRSVVAAGLLTQQQMEHAAERYRLGARVDESVIFWQIDHEGNVCEGKVMHYDDDCHRLKDADHRPRSMSSILKAQRNHDGEPELPMSWRGRGCLFGEELASPPSPLSPQRGGVDTLEGEETASLEGEINSVNSVNSCKTKDSEEEISWNSWTPALPPELAKNSLKKETNAIVAIVESEKTAVIMSEHYPDAIWLATGGINQFHSQLLLPLRGRRIILFPDTDPAGNTYQQWRQVAREAQQLLGHPVYVSDLLERHATAEQKTRKIDIVDYLAANKITS